MATIKHKESVELKTSKTNEKDAERKPPQIAYKKEGTQMSKTICERLEEIANKVDNDPATYEKEEEFYNRYGTLTPEDLRKEFTI